MRYGLDGRYIQDHFPGIGRYTYHLALALARVAPEDEFILFHDPAARNTQYDLGALAAILNLSLVEVAASPFRLRQQIALPRLARALRLDLYHSPYYLIPYVMPCPTVVTIHDLIPYLYPDSLPNPRLSGVFAAAIRLALRRAAWVLVDAASTRDDLARVMRADPARVTAAPLAADASFHPASPDEIAALRARLGLGAPYLLYLGINKPHKNLPRLVEAWAALPADLRAGRQLVLAGREDPRYPQARELAARLGLGGEVRFLGAVAGDDMPALYSGALGFVFPSVYEGFGLPVLEAMACGAPTACANTSSLAEIVGDASSADAPALLFDPHDVASLRDALARLLADDALRQRLSAAGQARARAFTWERAAEETIGVYRRVAHV